jgi:hypothetical protein
MKQLTFRLYFSFLFLSGFSLCINAQSDYTFKNPALVSGNHLQAGSVYRFTNVQNGLDAKVTLLALKGGFTLSSIDESSTGFDETFQPVLNMPANADGYAEFRVEFMDAGTNNLRIQPNVPVTCIDADGKSFQNGVIYENNEIQYFPGSYSYNKEVSGLHVASQSGWIAVKNTSGFDYSGLDTAAKQGMATVVNQNTSGFKIRLGAVNTSSAKFDGLRPVLYFKSFDYPNTRFMPNRTTLSFSGALKANAVELKGNLSASHTYDRIIVERGSSTADMIAIAEILITNKGVDEFSFTYSDSSPNEGVNYYRIRLVNTPQRIIETSNILMIEKDDNTKALKLNNTILNGNSPVLNITAIKNEEVKILLTDMSGNIVYHSKVKLNAGTNSINLHTFNTLRGYGLVNIETMAGKKSIKIIIQ